MPTDTSAPPASPPATSRGVPLRQVVAQARGIIADAEASHDKVLRATLFLIKQGFLQDSVPGLRRLNNAGAYVGRVRRMGLIVGYLLRRGWGRGLGTVEQDGKGWKIVDFSATSDVHVAPREGSKRAVFVFAGVGAERRAAFDLTLLLQFLRGFDTHIFMLRDSRKLLYMDGLQGLGKGVDQTAERLKAMAKDLGAERFFAIGNCGGSYAALRYGLAMDVERVLCFAPRTDYSGKLGLPEVDPDHYGRLDGLLAHERRDMREIYERAPKRPMVDIYYGAEHALDSAHAKHFDGLPGYTGYPVQGAAGRYIVPRLLRTGEFEISVGRLLDLPVVKQASVRRAAPAPETA